MDAEDELAYSTPIDVFTMVWNTILVTVIIVIISLSRDEVSPLPLRTWLVGYAALCIFRMGSVVLEYRNSRRGRRSSDLDLALLELAGYYTWLLCGFIGVCIGLPVFGLTIAHDAPKLFWLCCTILAIHVFSVVIFACIIGIALFFLTCAIYVMARVCETMNKAQNRKNRIE